METLKTEPWRKVEPIVEAVGEVGMVDGVLRRHESHPGTSKAPGVPLRVGEVTDTGLLVVVLRGWRVMGVRAGMAISSFTVLFGEAGVGILAPEEMKGYWGGG